MSIVCLRCVRARARHMKCIKVIFYGQITCFLLPVRTLFVVYKCHNSIGFSFRFCSFCAFLSLSLSHLFRECVSHSFSSRKSLLKQNFSFHINFFFCSIKIHRRGCKMVHTIKFQLIQYQYLSNKTKFVRLLLLLKVCLSCSRRDS